MIRGRFIIRGRVQGVCFRMYARSEARSLGLAGWVRNNPDGSVETVVEGPESAVGSFLEWCKSGPTHAGVSAVSAEYSAATGEFGAFEIVF